MGFFSEGQHIWVTQPDGSKRPGVFVGEAETAVWFGGPPIAYVVYPDVKDGESVELQRITRRDDPD